MYPIMIPIISSIKLFFVKAEKNSKIPMTIIAPAKAPANTARKPDILKTPAVILPPPSNINRVPGFNTLHLRFESSSTVLIYTFRHQEI